MKVLRGVVVPVACIVVAVLVGLALEGNSYWLKVMTLAFILGAVAQSWNLLAGYAGQWSLAQTAFFGIGAYGSGVALIHWGVPLLPGMFLAVAFTCIVAFCVGALTLRLRGHYFALVTFLLTVALAGLVPRFAGFTGGQYGLSIPIGEGDDLWQLQFQSQIAYYFLAVIVAAVATAVVYWVAHSRLGLLLRTIRDDEDAAQALGVKTLRLKVTAMVISASLASMAGTVYLCAYKLMDAETAFGLSGGLDPVVAGILGGPGSLYGGVLGELILQPTIAKANIAFGNSSFGAPQLVYGAVLMVAVLVIPRGLAGVARQLRDWYVNRSSSASGSAAQQPAAESEQLASTGPAERSHIESA